TEFLFIYLFIFPKGIGIREVLLMNGCPGGETKCIVGVEECHGPVDCGLGRPISENSKSVVMTCIYIPPENRFKYVWKILAPNKVSNSHILPNDSAVMEVRRDTHPITYQCETQGNESVIASVKYTVHATTGKLVETLTDLYHKTPKSLIISICFLFLFIIFFSHYSVSTFLFVQRGSFLFET
uniref:Sperm acrosome membrane-associated protein 1 n=1 Tax=Cairina moschata TaxID=8855 RepID=A0A8C3BU58_CAIMO